MRTLRLVLALLACALPTLASACRSPKRPKPPADLSLFANDETPLESAPRELGPYLEQYPLGNRGRRKDLLAATAERSMHLVQLALPLPSHQHPTRKEIAYVLRGRGEVRIDDRTYPAAPGAAFRIDAGRAHSVIPADGETLIAIVYYEPPLLEGDDSVPAALR